jgi:hypothetical protein
VAVGVAVAALAVYGLVTLVGRDRDDASSPPGSSTTQDQCLLGTWTFGAITFPNIPVSGQDTTFTGDGPTATFLADGVTNIDYAAGNGMTAQIDGGTYTVVFSGSSTARYSTRNGTLLTRDISVHGNYTVFHDGSPVSSGPIVQPSQNTGSGPYTCSADTLRTSAPNGLAEVLTRDTPQS